MTEAMSMGDAIASQIRRYRLLKSWSVRRLAEECERLGAPQLTASSLANIERGQDRDAKRTGRRVLVEELAVLAKALDVSPVELAFPIGQEPFIKVLPDTTVDTWSAVKWWIGKQEDPGQFGSTGEPGMLGYFRDHDEITKAVLWCRHTGESALADSHARSLRDLRKNMRRAGVLPPQLPADLADIDNDRTMERP